jgi:hypothetical protein
MTVAELHRHDSSGIPGEFGLATPGVEGGLVLARRIECYGIQEKDLAFTA